MLELEINMAELIPYKNLNELVDILKEEHKKGRYVEHWSGYVYSAMRWENVKKQCG